MKRAEPEPPKRARQVERYDAHRVLLCAWMRARFAGLTVQGEFLPDRGVLLVWAYDETNCNDYAIVFLEDALRATSAEGIVADLMDQRFVEHLRARPDVIWRYEKAGRRPSDDWWG